MFSVMLMDAYYDEGSGIRVAYRTDDHLLNQRRMHFQLRVSTTTVHELLFADDCALNTTSEGDMQRNMDLFAAAATAATTTTTTNTTACDNYSLVTNTKRTAVIHQLPPNAAYAAPQINVNGAQLQLVDNFTYLGSTLSRVTFWPNRPMCPHIEAVMPNMPIFPPFNITLAPMDAMRPPPPDLFPPPPFYQYTFMDSIGEENALRRLTRQHKNPYDSPSWELGESPLSLMKTARLSDVPPVGASFPLDKPVLPKVIPVIVLASGCGDTEVRKVIESYTGEISTLRPPDQSNIDVPPDQRRFLGYFRIAHHYKSVFEQIFTELKHTLAIVVEDDLDISIDFFDYFAALAPLLLNDSSLYCVSAWNDNGKKELIDASSPNLLYRTDFFPGLGWMLTKGLWEELRDKWPPAYWDEFLRTPEVRKNRSCIRPEISRTITFGSTGVSGGQFFNTHLRFIELNQQHVDFSNSNLSYLLPHIYNPNFHRQVYKDAQPVSISSLSSLTPPSADEKRAYRVNYRTQADFILAAKYLGVMQDFKYGVPRMAYAGVVSVFFRGNRVFLAPPTNWDHYDLSWT
ncbi:GNT-I [Sparganum proliferum]